MCQRPFAWSASSEGDENMRQVPATKKLSNRQSIS
jgi:hypothetical protein